MSACRKCSECSGNHHPVEGGPPGYAYTCKHCVLYGIMCECVDGENDDGEACAKCKGTGVLWESHVNLEDDCPLEECLHCGHEMNGAVRDFCCDDCAECQTTIVDGRCSGQCGCNDG